MVTVQGPSAIYSPGVGTAFAIYAFDVQGYVGDFSLVLDWEQPAPEEGCWLCIADFAARRWRSYSLDQPAAFNLGAFPPGLAGPTGISYAALVLNGPDSAELRSIRLGTNSAPIAQLHSSALSGTIDDSFSFDASASSDSDGSIASYSFELDGLPVDNGGLPVLDGCSFTSLGTHSVRLLVTDNEGATDEAELSIEISGDQPLAALSLSGDRPLTNEYIVLDASGSSAVNGELVSFVFDPEDDGLDLIDNGSDPVLHYAYVSAGILNARVTVTDSQGLSASAVKQLKVGWRRSLNQGSGDAEAQAAVLDSEGYSYIAGAYRAGSNSDPFVACYSPDGERLWSRLLPAGGNQAMTDLVLASDGTLYSTCWLSPAWPERIALLLKLDRQTGAVHWQRAIELPGELPALAAGPQGGCVLSVMHDHDPLDTENTYAAQFDATGELQWQVLFGSLDHADDRRVARQLETDSAGNVYLCGFVEDNTFAGAFPLLSSLSPTGDLRWSKKVNLVPGNSELRDICFSDGLLHCCGDNVHGSFADHDLLLSFDTMGGLTRALRLSDGPYNFFRLAGDGQGGLMLSGNDVFETSYNALYLRLDAAGQIQQQQRLAFPGGLAYGAGLLAFPDGSQLRCGSGESALFEMQQTEITIEHLDDVAVHDFPLTLSVPDYPVTTTSYSFDSFAPATEDEGGAFMLRYYD